MSGGQRFDLGRVRRHSIEQRPSKVSVAQFGRPMEGCRVEDLLRSFPDILVGAGLRRLVSRIQAARGLGKPIVWGFGGHLVKVGLGPILIDLMERGFVSALATNGSGMIHDFEVALWGKTSEDVDEQLETGEFGMAEETGKLLNEAICKGVVQGLGMGESVGAFLGEGSFRDFQLFTHQVSLLEGGGVFINVGSAVVLPEVFLKAVTAVRSAGQPLADFTTANFDFFQHYRPTQNVVRRPVSKGGWGIGITGHHEIMIPLLAALLRCPEHPQPNPDQE